MPGELGHGCLVEGGRGGHVLAAVGDVVLGDGPVGDGPLGIAHAKVITG